MAKQTINLGTAPTGVGGDTPRSAFTKTQANVDELYANFVNMGLGNTPVFLTSPALNSIDTFGFYYASTLTQGPTGEQYGWLLVQPYTASYVTQTFTSSTSGNVWFRSKLNGTWGAWGRAVTSSNVNGTVSQTAGVATGAIIEAGSNASGTYTKFADGTLMCIARPTGSPSVAANTFTVVGPIALPATFIDTAYFVAATGAPSASNDQFGFSYGYANTASSASVVYRNGATAQTVTNIRIFCTGRWF